MSYAIGLAVGALLGGAVLYGALQLPFFKVTCPTIAGRVCNAPWGVCDRGVCVCDARFSGHDCSGTACPGYAQFSGAVCSGLGVCSPLLTNVLPACAEDWTSAACAAYRANAVATNNLTQLVGVPQCLCAPPLLPSLATGTCALEMCPENEAGQRCSGNGLPSVNFTRNNTVAGEGCQCAQRFTLIEYTDQFTVDGMAVVAQSISVFAATYCGTVSFALGGFYVYQNQSAACFCIAGWLGVACEYGSCPQVQNVICSGRGDPAFGQGLLYNTTQNATRYGACTPHCLPGLQACADPVTGLYTCLINCLHALKCADDTPWRCADGSCQPQPTTCLANSAYGYLDDFDSVRGVYLQPNTVYNFSTPVVFYSFAGAGVLRVGRLNEPPLFTTIGAANAITAGTVAVDYTQLDTWAPNATVYWSAAPDAQGDVELYPAPFLYPPQGAPLPLGVFRLSSPAGVVVMDFVRSALYLLPVPAGASNDTLVVVQGPLGFLAPGGVLQTSACFANLAACVWALGSAPGGNASVVDTRFVGRQRTPQNDWSGHAWQLELQVPTVWIASVTGSGVEGVELVPQGALQQPCACPSSYGYTEANTTVYDAQWAAQAYRSAATPTDFAVVIYRGLGDQRPVRATLSSAGAGAPNDVVASAPGYPDLLIPLSDVRYLSPLEFATGTPDCDARVLPAKCGDGACAPLELRYATVLLSCDCAGSYATNFTCACPSPCTCAAQACSCPALSPLFASQLAGQIAALANCTVQFAPPPAGPSSSLGVYNATAALWFAAEKGSLLEVLVTGCGGPQPTLFADGAAAGFAQDCDNGTLVLTPLGLDEPAVWSAGVSAQPTFLWSPAGAPVTRATAVQLSASSGDPTSAVLELDRAGWSSVDSGPSWIQLDFAREFALNAVLVQVTQAGVRYAGGRVLPVQLRLQGAFEGVWYTLGTLTTNVYANGVFAATIAVSPERPYDAVKLSSPLPMAVRAIMPFASQTASCDAIALNRTVSPLPGPCVGDDSCAALARNGVCNDARYEAFLLGLPLVYQFLGLPNIDLLAYFASAYGFAGQAVVVNGSVIVYNATNSSQPLLSNFSFGYLVVPFDAAFAYPPFGLPSYNYSYLAPSSLGVRAWGLWYGIENVTCATGTDYTDCGCSARPGPLPAPGLPCILNNTLDTYPSVTLYNLSLEYTYVNLSSACPFRCALFQCPDGRCAATADACAQTLYDCPGNGCLQATEEVYFCQCQGGVNGPRCEFAECVPGSTNPYLACMCGWEGPLAMRQPGVDLQQNYTDAQVAALNYQLEPKTGPGDVGPKYVVNTHASGFVRFAQPQMCPYAVRGPRGEYLLERDCAIYDDGIAVAWRTFYDLGGAAYQYVWTSPTAFNDFPVKCPNNRYCVSNLQECYQHDFEGFCNGHGTCMSDGTCQCAYGYTTFLYTAAYSQLIMQAYNPATPQDGEPLDNWRNYYASWCTARDCTVQDCGYLACFSGTAANSFADKQVTCGAYTGFGGQCATTQQACVGGQVAAPIPCSGNGIPRLVDNTNDQYTCLCGSPISPLLSSALNVSQSTELQPNGFGGPLCNIYYCDELAARIRFLQINPATGKPYVNAVGQGLPGLWVGACGAPIGPDPDQLALWNTCCPNLLQLELCAMVPCLVQNAYVCMAAQDCIPTGGAPQIYPCNNHGTARKDGTCLCDTNEASGFGYGPDADRFSYAGCFKALSCPICPELGTVCCQTPACSMQQNWVAYPKVDYWNQQIYSLVNADGLPVTNKTIVEAIAPQYAHRLQIRVQALTEDFLETQDVVTSFASCDCVYPNETANTSNPVGMRSTQVLPSPTITPTQAAALSAQAASYVYPYLKAFKTPYALTIVNASVGGTLLYDEAFFAETDSLRPGVDYAVLDASITVQLDNAYHFTYVRPHIYVLNGSATLQIVFPDGASCAPLSLIPNEVGLTFVWQGHDGNAILCSTTYVDYDFTLQKAEYNVYCVDVNSVACETWQQGVCKAQNNVVPAVGDYYPGCTQQRCCVVSRLGPQGAYSNFTLTAVPGLTGAAFVGWIDELNLLGYADSVLPPGPILQAQLQRAQNTTCVDEDYFAEVGIVDQSYNVPLQNQSTWNDSVCPLAGGWTASPNEASTTAYDAMGIACGTNRQSSVASCWVAAADRNKVPAPSNNSIMLASCSTQGCWLPQPLSTVDMFAIGDSYRARYTDPARSPGVAPIASYLANLSYWQSFGAPTGYDPSFFTQYAGCTVKLYAVRNCAPPANDNLQTTTINYNTHTFFAPSSTFDSFADRLVDCDQTGVSDPICSGQVSEQLLVYVYSIGITGPCDLRVVRNPNNVDVGVLLSQASASTVISKTTSGATTCYNVNIPTNSYLSFTTLQAVPTVPVYNIEYNLAAPAALSNNLNDEFLLTYDAFPYMCYTLRTEVASVTQGCSIYDFSLECTTTSFTLGPVQFLANFSGLILASDVLNGFARVFQNCTWMVTCPECQVERASSLQWDQRFLSTTFNTFNTYVDGLVTLEPSAFSQVVLSDGTSPTYVRLDAGASSYWPLSTPPPSAGVKANKGLDQQYPAAFAHLSCNMNTTNYGAKWDLSWCMYVLHGLGGNSFQLDVCQNVRNHLCIYDVAKYIAQAGSQCDKCGPSTRITGYAQPGATCYTQFPGASPSYDPYRWYIYQCGLADNLTLVAATSDGDYDADMAYFFQSNTTISAAYPGFYDWWPDGLSTRAQTLNPQGTVASLDWLDFNLQGAFPFECPGRPCDKNTGICRRRCAAAQPYCDPNAPQYDGPVMAADAYPAFLRPLPNDTDYAVEPSCGDLIQVALYGTDQDWGGGHVNQLVIPLKPPADAAKFRLVVRNGTWSNPYQVYHQFVANSTQTLSGTITVSGCTACSPAAVLWISPLGLPPQPYVVANLSLQLLTTQFRVEFDVPPGPQYTVLGFDVYAQPRFTVTLSNVLATSNVSIAACAARVLNTAWVETPSSIYSGAYDNRCVFDSATPGCDCYKAFCGAACQFPCLPLAYAQGRSLDRYTCGGWGAPGLVNLAATTAAPNVVAVLEDGAYLTPARSECKCRDVGKIIRTAFRADSAFGNLYVPRSDGGFGQPEFTSTLANISTADGGNKCAAQGALLPSWPLANDVTSLLAAWQGNPIVIGLVNDSGALAWQQSGLVASAPQPVTPCPGTLCAVLNYNNLVFNASQTLTDGLFVATTTVPAGAGNAVSLAARAYHGTSLPTVVFWGSDAELQFLTVACCATLASYVSGVSATYSCACSPAPLVFYNPSTSFALSEVQMFSDSARV